MDVLPAIDLLDAQVVRLTQGDYEKRRAYSSDPAAIARRLVEAGARWIHVVDLDAARTGRPTNLEAVRAIRGVASQAGARVQLGGGARDRETIAFLHDGLADRVVVGSAALKDWAWFARLLADDQVPADRLALALDCRAGRLAIHGWTEELPDSAVELARRVRGSHLGAIVYTDVQRDGMMSGPNFGAVAEIIEATDVPVIASGGITSLRDIDRCREIGCAGAIVGRAWYEGRIDLAKAFAAAGQEPDRARRQKKAEKDLE